MPYVQLKAYAPELNVMTSAELTKQAFKLYDNIRLQSYRTPIHPGHSTRLHCLGLRALYRYKRRMKAEQNQIFLFHASRWGF